MNRHICIDRISPRARAVGFIEKYWNPGDTLRVKFLNGLDTQKNFVRGVITSELSFLNINFQWVLEGVAEIRITFNNDGSWSYIGKDCLNIPQNQATMNFGWLDKAVVLHEFGHAIGYGHEHQNPEGGIQWDEDAVVADLSGPPNYWDYNTIYWNVLRKYQQEQINGTALDPLSIMMYGIPEEWTLNDFSTDFNSKLSVVDKEFWSQTYPVEQGPTPEQEAMIEAFRYMFSNKSEMLDLNEGPIVRIGRLIGADTHMRFLKSDNINRVDNILELGKRNTDDGTTKA